MVEREMQELLWRYPERFLNEPLTQFAWETQSNVGRADLVFEDRHGRLLIIEVKRGKLPDLQGQEARRETTDVEGGSGIDLPDGR